MADERQRYKLEQELSSIEVSWETRGVFDCGEHRIAAGDVLYLAHSFLAPYATDSAGNMRYGIRQSPSPGAACYRKAAADQESPEHYLQRVVAGEVNPGGAGELLGH
ncbi:hypothetical protein ACT3UD_12995 [Glutamicibacter sp. 287]|uniref:hypothetical protein n=1 Tax=unclassified Glutamicibacter TaxID=2627139 RepID=UPI004034E904